MSLELVRNLGIVAHIDAGKTTVSERILFYAGIERRMGEVHEGTAVMDWMEEERKRGITITSAATTVPWKGHTINLIDTPGHVDFTVEVERCMRVLDGAVLVLNAVSGVQAQSETVWHQMQRHGVPALAFVNQLDRPGADFMACVADLKQRLGAPAVPVQFPILTGGEFRRVVDLVGPVAWEYSSEDQGQVPQRIEIPAEVADEVGVLRAELIELLAEGDEDVLAAFSQDREPTSEQLHRALRAEVLHRRLLPVFAGSALRNVGIQGLLDGVLAYLPSPLDVEPVCGKPVDGEGEIRRPPDVDGPRCALAFKLEADPHEDLTFVRVYSGTLRPGEKLFNPRVGRMERISRVLRMHADARQPLEQALPGDIVALTGLRHTVTGDTLCEHDGALLLEEVAFPDPVITRVVEPRATKDRDRLRAALDRLAFEDPSFVVREDEETGQWLIAGMGELHLEIKEHRLQQDFQLEVAVGTPRVAYREAIAKGARCRASVDRVLGGERVLGEVELELVPADPDQLESRPERPSLEWAADASVPEEYRSAMTEVLVNSVEVGPRFGYPLSGGAVRVVGGGPPSERSAELGYTQAALQALRQGLQESEICLLEPVMSFEVTAPAEFMSGILGELNAKKATIAQLEAEGPVRRVVGRVPLFHMFGFATTLRSLSQGRAGFSLAPAGFRPVSEAELEGRGLIWR